MKNGEENKKKKIYKDKHSLINTLSPRYLFGHAGLYRRNLSKYQKFKYSRKLIKLSNPQYDLACLGNAGFLPFFYA